MGNLQSSPSSSNTVPRKKYDVFINFRGEDTRDSFTSHLYDALRRKQIETFIDYEIEKGDELSSALMTAIKESKISVVIFSKDYASSKWCLRELVEILKCTDQIVLPVFYRVYPSDVRNQTGSFKDSFVEHEKNSQKKFTKTWSEALAEASVINGWNSSVGRTDAEIVEEIVDDIWEKLMSGYLSPDFENSFAKHENKFQEEVETWREALAEASVIKGWHSSVGRTDATLVEEIVNDIWKKLISVYIPRDFGELIGLKPRIEQIISSLCLHVTTDVRIIGIWGMGGIGKTTLADAIFNQNKNQFGGFCFIPNVRERLANIGGSVSVQEEILSKVLKGRNIKLDSLTIPPKIKKRLIRKKVFIVLDDVDDSLKMETLVKGVDGLGQGSRIIITSRDKQVLRNCHVNDDNIYEVEGFNYDEAHRLFCKYAFHGNHHSEDLMVDQLVNFTNGNPLALIVLGSLLYEKSKEEWESVVNKFEPTNLNRKIFDVLKMSYDELEVTEKDIFLDIACFLKGRKKDYVAKILDDCHNSLSVLINKSLITISHRGTIEMHDLLEEMGRELGKQSRLWRPEDVLCTLKNVDGTPKVHGIVLDMIKINKDIHLSSQVFKKMPNLRLLQFYDSTYYDYSKVNCSEDLSDPFDKLRSLIWYGYPLQALPSNFDPNNLVELDLRGSNLERLWDDCMEAPKLRWLNLSGCIRVTKIQGLSKSPLLESINLKDCRSLLDFPQLAQHLKNLYYLDRSGCNNLRSFPSDIHFESLTSLDLSNCYNLTKFGSQISGNNITSLDLSGTAIKELHHSISHLNGLVKLSLGRCENLETFPSGICNMTSLQHLDLSDCSRLEILPENLGNLKSLKYLYVKRAAIKELPHSIAHLNGLQELFLGGCENLETLPSCIGNLKYLRHLDLSDCSRLEILQENFGNLKSLKYLSADRIAICQLPYSMEGFRYSLRRLCLSDCNLDYIPEDIHCLFFLVELDLSVNNFDGLPQSMRELSDLKSLHLDNCNGIVSLIDLPPNLKHLSACDCKQLQSIPNELDFALVSGKLFFDKSKPESNEFIFTNCMNLEETAVGNMLARLVKYRYRCQRDIRFSFCYPGSEVPQWFRSTTEGSSIKFQDTFDSNLKGFAVCAVIAFEKYLFNGDSQHKLGIKFDGTCSDADQSSQTTIMSETAYFASRNRSLIDSDHVAFAYCDANYRLKSCGDFGTQSKNYSFEFRLSEESPNYRLKSCGVCSIYFQDPDTDDSNEAGTSGSRFDEEEMEPHP